MSLRLCSIHTEMQLDCMFCVGISPEKLEALAPVESSLGEPVVIPAELLMYLVNTHNAANNFHGALNLALRCVSRMPTLSETVIAAYSAKDVVGIIRDRLIRARNQYGQSLDADKAAAAEELSVCIGRLTFKSD